MESHAVNLILFLYIVKSNGQYSFISRDPKYNGNSYNEYPRVAITGIEPYKVESKVDSSDCIRNCEANRKECESINVIKESNGTFSCFYFTNENGQFEDREVDTRYISRRQPKCSGYCRELDYIDLCGKCRCVDKCNSKFSHFCDCTNALLEVKEDCKDIRASGFNDPAMYRMEVGMGRFNGFCERKEDGSSWLTMMRRFKEKDNFFMNRTIHNFKNGFGKSHDEMYWLGLKHVYKFAAKEASILRVEVMTFDNENWYGEYERIKLKLKNNRYIYHNTKFRTNCCLGNPLSPSTNYFQKCSNGQFWFDQCVRNSPTDEMKIRWAAGTYKRITLLLRHGTLPPFPSPEYGEDGQPILVHGMIIVKTNNLLGTIRKLGTTYCIMFDLYVNTLAGGSLLDIGSSMGSHTNVFFLNNKLAFRRPTTHVEYYSNAKLKVWMKVTISQILVDEGYQFTISVDNEVVDSHVYPLSRFGISKDMFVNAAYYAASVPDRFINNLYINGKQYFDLTTTAPIATSPAPTTPEPAPTTPEPAPTTPEPGPTTPEPAPTTPESVPTTPEPVPTTPEPAPTTKRTTRQRTSRKPNGWG